MDTINKTGVPSKTPGDSLSHQDINAINSTTNYNVDATNYLLQSFCNINAEVNNYTKTFTLEEAISTVPESRRNPGMKIRFLSSDETYVEYTYGNSSIEDESWENTDNWRSVSSNIIDGGEW